MTGLQTGWRQFRDEKILAEAHRAIAEGEKTTGKQIGETLGVSATTVNEVLKTHGISLRKSKVKLVKERPNKGGVFIQPVHKLPSIDRDNPPKCESCGKPIERKYGNIYNATGKYMAGMWFCDHTCRGKYIGARFGNRPKTSSERPATIPSNLQSALELLGEAIMEIVREK